MPRHARQPVTGINVNDHCNTPRAEFETLKAILDNCTITGPETQNRSEIASFRAYLEGRIASIRRINPGRAGKLYALFDRINWPPAGSG